MENVISAVKVCQSRSIDCNAKVAELLLNAHQQANKTLKPWLQALTRKLALNDNVDNNHDNSEVDGNDENHNRSNDSDFGILSSKQRPMVTRPIQKPGQEMKEQCAEQQNNSVRRPGQAPSYVLYLFVGA